MLGAAEDDRNGGSISEAAEDDGSGGSFRKTTEDGGSTYYNRVFSGRAEVMRITEIRVIDHVCFLVSLVLLDAQPRLDTHLFKKIQL